MMTSLATTWRRLLTILVRPAKVGEQVRQAPARADGAVAVAQLGAVWAAFCAALFAGGHSPSFSLLPIAVGRYYLWQALFVIPLTLALWWVMCTVAARVAGANTAERKAATFAALGYAYAGPLIIAFLLVDIAIYAMLGFAAMGRLIRFYAPIAPLWAVVAGTLCLRAALSLNTGRALAAVVSGMLVQALIGGVFLR